MASGGEEGDREASSARAHGRPGFRKANADITPSAWTGTVHESSTDVTSLSFTLGTSLGF